MFSKIAGLSHVRADWRDYHDIRESLRHRIMRLGGGYIDGRDAREIADQAVGAMLPFLHLRARQHHLSDIGASIELLLKYIGDSALAAQKGQSPVQAPTFPAASALVGEQRDVRVLQAAFGPGTSPTRYRLTLRRMRSEGFFREYIIITKHVDLVDLHGFVYIDASKVAYELTRSGIDTTQADVERAQRRFRSLMDRV